MSIRWNDIHAHEASIDWTYPLSERGEDYNKPGEYAITIAGDDVFAVYGKPDDLVEFARQISQSARQIHGASLKPGRHCASNCARLLRNHCSAGSCSRRRCHSMATSNFAISSGNSLAHRPKCWRQLGSSPSGTVAKVGVRCSISGNVAKCGVV